MIFLPIDSKKKEKKKGLPSPRKLDQRRVEARKTKGRNSGKAKGRRSANAKGRKLNRRRNVKGQKLSSFGLSATVGLSAMVSGLIGDGKLIDDGWVIGDDECIIGDGWDIGDGECAYR